MYVLSQQEERVRDMGIDTLPIRGLNPAPSAPSLHIERPRLPRTNPEVPDRRMRSVLSQAASKNIQNEFQRQLDYLKEPRPMFSRLKSTEDIDSLNRPDSNQYSFEQQHQSNTKNQNIYNHYPNSNNLKTADGTNSHNPSPLTTGAYFRNLASNRLLEAYTVGEEPDPQQTNFDKVLWERSERKKLSVNNTTFGQTYFESIKAPQKVETMGQRLAGMTLHDDGGNESDRNVSLEVDCYL